MKSYKLLFLLIALFLIGISIAGYKVQKNIYETIKKKEIDKFLKFEKSTIQQLLTNLVGQRKNLPIDFTNTEALVNWIDQNPRIKHDYCSAIHFKSEKKNELLYHNQLDFSQKIQISSQSINPEFPALIFTYSVSAINRNIILLQDSVFYLEAILFSIILLFICAFSVSINIRQRNAKAREDHRVKEKEFHDTLKIIQHEVKEKNHIEKIKEQDEQLLQADKMSSLGILSSGVAHEINNPNSYISLNTEILAKAWDDALPILEEYFKGNAEAKLAGIPFTKMKEKFPTLISSIQNGSERISKIVSDLKKFSSNEPNIQEPLTAIQVNLVIQKAVELTDHFIKKKTKFFTLTLEENLPDVMANEQKLEQVIVNLLINAAQALEGTEKKIWLNSYQKDNHIFIQVKDEGCGIKEEAQKNIFDPFFTTKHEDGGTGLGLSISYGIIQNFKGNISCKSALNKGTLFEIELPIKKCENRK